MSIENKNIPEYRIELIPLTVEAQKARGFPMSDPNIGNRWKIGGKPDFIQNELWPKCPSCGEKMAFYAQLDAIGDGYDIADCGLVYVFMCFDCYETKSY